MRWFKKIVRAILALLPVFAVLLIPSANTSALKHDYDGLLIQDSLLIPKAESINGSYVLPDNFSDYYSGWNNSLQLIFLDSVYLIDSITPFNPYNFWLPTGNIISVNASGGFSNTSISPNCLYGNAQNSFSLRPQLSLSSSYFSNAYHHYLELNSSSYFFGNFSHSGSSGYTCLNYDYQTSHPVILNTDNELSNFQNFTHAETLSAFYNYTSPHTSSSNGLTLHKDAVSDSNGLTYSHSFSFSRLFSGTQPNKFYSMSIPLNTTDNYFMNSDNLYRGRQLQFKLLFKFDGSFAWNPDVSQGYSRINAVAYSVDNASHNDRPDSVTFNCTNNVVQVSGHTHLEITCPYTLDKDYLAFVPRFEIYNPNYVWDSDSWWEFYSFYLVTDGDDTPGDRFNSDIVDNLWSPVDGVGGDGSCNDFDLACKLNNLFIFSIPVSNTPLGGILGNFSDQSSCASIPTIAGMIHSNETQICPWFSSNVRSIATPVLSLFSVCLVFGFIVRWLKSSSGDNMLNSHKNGDKD